MDAHILQSAFVDGKAFTKTEIVEIIRARGNLLFTDTAIERYFPMVLRIR